MNIKINGKEVAVKQGQSIEYVEENRFFTDSDGYTLAIELPLAGCAMNEAIFGYINRNDVDVETLVFECEIESGSFHKKGVAAIVEINDAEVKLQFLEGRSAQNYRVDFDDVYINELNLGAPQTVDPKLISPQEAWGLYSKTPSQDYPNRGNYIAFPWWNSSSELTEADTNVNYLQNHVKDVSGIWKWHPDLEFIAWTPYMRFLAERIALAIGFRADFSKWENHPVWKWLLSCNALPGTWENPHWETALPHWTVNEFFRQLEYLMGADFNFDFFKKTVSVEWVDAQIKDIPSVELNNVIDEFSQQIKNAATGEDESAERPQIFKYSDAVGEAESCDWLVHRAEAKDLIVAFAPSASVPVSNEYAFEIFGSAPSSRPSVESCMEVLAEEILQFNPTPAIYQQMDFDSEWNTYYIAKFGDYLRSEDCEKTVGSSKYLGRRLYYSVEIEKVAQFAPWLDDKQEEQATEIAMVPVKMIAAEGRNVPTIECGEMGERINSVAIKKTQFSGKILNLGNFSNLIESGKDDEAPEYLSNIFVAFAPPPTTSRDVYCPIIDKYTVVPGSLTPTQTDFFDGSGCYGFRIGNNRKYNDSIAWRDVDVTRTYHFSWIVPEGASIPDVRAVYYIAGKRYLCSKITATFTDTGMSQLLKGEFYRIK